MIEVGILTISDRSARGERSDESGPAIREMIEQRAWAHRSPVYKIIPDDLDEIAATLANWCDELQLSLILTTGGTGFTPRDVTPEATLRVIERRAPGFEEAMRAESLKQHRSRHAVAGRRRHTRPDDHRQPTRQPQSRS